MNSNFGLQQKAALTNRTEAREVLNLKSISDSHLFPGYNLLGLYINDMTSMNNYVYF